MEEIARADLKVSRKANISLAISSCRRNHMQAIMPRQVYVSSTGVMEDVGKSGKQLG